MTNQQLTEYILRARNAQMTDQQIADELLKAGWSMSHFVGFLAAGKSLAPVREVAISAIGVRKVFGKVQALDGVNIEVPYGSVFALLGPNGAGKTTLVRCIATLLDADAGEVTLDGIDPKKDGRTARSSIGVTGQFAALDEILTGRENLELFAKLHHLDQFEAIKRSYELLSKFDLLNAADRPVKTYSGGMKRRLDLAASLIHDPKIIFLDEPTTGLDPASRLSLWQIVKELVASGKAIFLTTQYMEEADHLADRIAVIDHGKIVAEGTADELKAKVGGDMIEVHLNESTKYEYAHSLLNSFSPETDPEEKSLGIISMAAPRGASDLITIIRILAENNVKIKDIALRKPTMDDVFLSLTGHKIRN